MSEQRKYRSWTALQKLEIVLAGLRGPRRVVAHHLDIEGCPGLPASCTAQALDALDLPIVLWLVEVGDVGVSCRPEVVALLPCRGDGATAGVSHNLCALTVVKPREVSERRAALSQLSRTATATRVPRAGRRGARYGA